MNFVLNDEMKTLQLAGMLRAAGNQIDPRGFQRAVAQHVGQLRHVPAHPVKCPGEQVPQIVGEDLIRRHAGSAAQPLHLRPDLPSGQAPSASGEKNLAGGVFLRFGVLFQLPAQFPRQENRPHFYRVCRDIVKLADVLGHSSVETTRIYLISTGAEHAGILKKMSLIL